MPESQPGRGAGLGTGGHPPGACMPLPASLLAASVYPITGVYEIRSKSLKLRTVSILMQDFSGFDWQEEAEIVEKQDPTEPEGPPALTPGHWPVGLQGKGTSKILLGCWGIFAQ